MTRASNKFRIALEREYEDKVVGGVLELKKKIGNHLIESIVEKMPVDTGMALGNNIVSAGIRDTSIDEGALDRSGAATIYNGKSVIASDIDPFGKLYVQNNVPYIEALEGGHSQQAPIGMYGLAVAEVGVFFG